MSSIKAVRERIGDGAALLDADCPGWEARVNLSTLNLRSCKMCVLGQIYGDYDAGKEALDILSGTAYGFNAEEVKWETLKREWVRFVGKRLLALAKRAQSAMRRHGIGGGK